MSVQEATGGNREFFKVDREDIDPEYAKRSKNVDSWVLCALKYGAEFKFENKYLHAFSQFPPIKYVVSPLIRLVYSVGSTVLLGTLGAIYHGGASAYYKLHMMISDSEENQKSTRFRIGYLALGLSLNNHKDAMKRDLASLFSMCIIGGEVSCFMYTIDAKVGYIYMDEVSQIFNKCCGSNNNEGDSSDDDA